MSLKNEALCTYRAQVVARGDRPTEPAVTVASQKCTVLVVQPVAHPVGTARSHSAPPRAGKDGVLHGMDIRLIMDDGGVDVVYVVIHQDVIAGQADLFTE